MNKFSFYIVSKLNPIGHFLQEYYSVSQNIIRRCCLNEALFLTERVKQKGSFIGCVHCQSPTIKLKIMDALALSKHSSVLLSHDFYSIYFSKEELIPVRIKLK